MLFRSETETTSDETTVALTDDNGYSASADATFSSATYTRTPDNDEVNTWTPIYLPFSFNVADYATSFDVAEIFAFCPYLDTNNDGVIDADDDDILLVNIKSSGKTLPNIPYLLRPKSSDTYTISSNDGKLYAAANGSVRTATTKTIYTFVGVNKETAATAANGLYYLSNGALTSVTSGSYAIKPFHWYATVTQRTDNYGITTQAQAKPSYRIAVIGEDIEEATALQVIRSQAGSHSTSYLYDLTGRRINITKALSPGIYIQDKRKITVK